ncbi:MAG: hypothetical protein R3C10_11910 [Pirellulales bacterium]
MVVDQTIVNRILNLVHPGAERVETYRQFQALEKKEFVNVDVILLRCDQPKLFRLLEACTASLAVGVRPPCLVRVTESPVNVTGLPGALRLMTQQTGRDLKHFAHNFVIPTRNLDPTLRRPFVERLKPAPTESAPDCAFRDRYAGTISEDMMLVFERLLAVFALLRAHISPAVGNGPHISELDYAAARALVQSLPLKPVDRRLSPAPLKSATTIFAEVHRPKYQLSLPDRSDEGNKWFTRASAARWCGIGTTTTKKYIDQLEGDGILLSAVAEYDRQRGKEIHYRFAAGRTPPFDWTNPFEGLPDLSGTLGC